MKKPTPEELTHLILSLEEDDKSCQEKVDAAIAEHEDVKALLASAKRMKQRFYPNGFERDSQALSTLLQPIPLGKQKLLLEDYRPYLEKIVSEDGSQHKEEIHSKAELLIGRKLSVDQIYRALLKLSRDVTSIVEEDRGRRTEEHPRGGFFKPRDVRPVVDESGKQNQSSLTGVEAAIA